MKNTKTSRKRTRKSKKKKDDRVDIVRRKVQMDGSVWYEDPRIVYTGIITKREKYRGRNKEVVDGYVVKWCDGKRENWPYESLLPCLVPETSDNDVVMNMRKAAIKNSTNDNALVIEKEKDIQSESDCDDPEKRDFQGEHMSGSGSDSEYEIKPEDW